MPARVERGLVQGIVGNGSMQVMTMVRKKGATALESLLGDGAM